MIPSFLSFINIYLSIPYIMSKQRVMYDTILENCRFMVKSVVYVSQYVNEFHKYHKWSGEYDKNGNGRERKIDQN